MKKFLIVGLESCCTRFVTYLVADNLNIEFDKDSWDGTKAFENEEFHVLHRSLPHSSRENFFSLEDADTFDKIIICSRDFHCSLISKSKIHQKNKDKAQDEHQKGMKRMQEFLKELNHKTYIFSYESAFLLQDVYINHFLRSLDIEYNKKVKIEDINKKYLKE